MNCETAFDTVGIVLDAVFLKIKLFNTFPFSFVI